MRYSGKRLSLDDGEGENLVAVIGMIGGIGIGFILSGVGKIEGTWNDLCMWSPLVASNITPKEGQKLRAEGG